MIYANFSSIHFEQSAGIKTCSSQYNFQGDKKHPKKRQKAFMPIVQTNCGTCLHQLPQLVQAIVAVGGTNRHGW